MSPGSSFHDSFLHEQSNILTLFAQATLFWSPASSSISLLLYLSPLLTYNPILHLEQQDAFHRLVDALNGQLTMLKGLLESSDDGGHLSWRVWAFHQIIASDDRENRRLRQRPALTDAFHVEAIGNHDAIISQLIAQQAVDGFRRQFGGQIGVDGGHQDICGHKHSGISLRNHHPVGSQIDAFKLREAALDNGQAQMGVRGHGAEAGEVFEASGNVIFLQTVEKCARVGNNDLGSTAKHARLQNRRINRMYIDDGSKVGVHAQLPHPLRSLRPLLASNSRIAGGGHLRRRGQIAMKGVQPVYQAAFLIGCDEQRDTSIVHSLSREGIQSADNIVRRVKVMVARLIHETANELLRNHLLQPACLVAIAQVFHHNQLTKLLIERHPRHDLLHLLQFISGLLFRKIAPAIRLRGRQRHSRRRRRSYRRRAGRAVVSQYIRTGGKYQNQTTKQERIAYLYCGQSHFAPHGTLHSISSRIISRIKK